MRLHRALRLRQVRQARRTRRASAPISLLWWSMQAWKTEEVHVPSTFTSVFRTPRNRNSPRCQVWSPAPSLARGAPDLMAAWMTIGARLGLCRHAQAAAQLVEQPKPCPYLQHQVLLASSSSSDRMRVVSDRYSDPRGIDYGASDNPSDCVPRHSQLKQPMCQIGRSSRCQFSA